MFQAGSQMCTTTALILESGKELDGAFEREVVPVRDLTECSNYCTRSLTERGLFCRFISGSSRYIIPTLIKSDNIRTKRWYNIYNSELTLNHRG